MRLELQFFGGRGSSGGNNPLGKSEVTVSDLSKASKEWSRTHEYGTKATTKEKAAAEKNRDALNQAFTEQAKTDAGKISILKNMKAGANEEAVFSYKNSKNESDNVFVYKVDKNTYRIRFPMHKDATYEGTASQVVRQINKLTAGKQYTKAAASAFGSPTKNVPVSYSRDPKTGKTKEVLHPEKIRKLKG